jgi:hypothetical protein
MLSVGNETETEYGKSRIFISSEDDLFNLHLQPHCLRFSAIGSFVETFVAIF